MNKLQKEFKERLRRGDPLVSVVIPCFRHASMLEEAVASAVNQDYPHIEIIIVNDGSPDNVSETAHRLISSFPRRKIHLIEQDNKGVSAARNAGLKASAGSVVMCLDADDLIAPSYISAGVSCLRETGAGIFCSAQQNFGVETGQWAPGEYSAYRIRYYNCITNAALYDKALFEATGGYKVSFSFAEDWEYWITCSRLGVERSMTEDRLYFYRVSEGGLAATFIHGRYRDCTAMIQVANEDLYPVEEVLMAQKDVPKMSSRAIERIRLLDSIHSEEWVLKLCIGLILEEEGKRSEAMQNYWRAVELTGERNWQPFYRLSGIFEGAGQHDEAAKFYRIVLTLRPDMFRIVVPRLASMGKAG